jgi:hypothetical protein
LKGYFLHYFGLLSIINAAITPGIQPHNVNRKTIIMEPQPLSITDNGGNTTANNTCKHPIFFI